MSRNTYLILSIIFITLITLANYNMIDSSDQPSRSHGGSTIFLPGSGNSGWHK